MRYATERLLAARIKVLGESASAAAAAELLEATRSASPLVRRLAASALGKLAGVVDATTTVTTLLPLLGDPHPQVRQYAAKALSAFGTAAQSALPDLRALYANPIEKDYVKRSVLTAGKLIREALRAAENQAILTCRRCGVRIAPDERARSQKAFERDFCDKCFDEVYLERRNMDTKIELNKTITTRSSTLVQSDGERIIAEFLDAHGIAYRYDERIRIIEGFAIRPDFYLPEFDVYIEYWGMDTTDYKIGMHKKRSSTKRKTSGLCPSISAKNHGCANCSARNSRAIFIGMPPEAVMFAEDELLPISALQHLVFCPRQCALIHLEHIWDDNRYTAEGDILHAHVHERGCETRGDTRIARNVPLRSLALGLVGVADCVAFTHAGQQITAAFPVEYKRGKPKPHRADEVQLCAQALCLEEMLGIAVPRGALFYGQTRRRMPVELDDDLRKCVQDAALRLHALFAARRTPPRHKAWISKGLFCHLPPQILLDRRTHIVPNAAYGNLAAEHNGMALRAERMLEPTFVQNLMLTVPARQ